MATHFIEIDHAPKRKNGKLQYIFRIKEARSRKIIAQSQQYSRKIDAVNVLARLRLGLYMETYEQVDLCKMKKSKFKVKGK
jgi:uncharacterized protein YegP (UPF0339 family)